MAATQVIFCFLAGFLITISTSFVNGQECYGSNEVYSSCMPQCGPPVTCEHLRVPPVCADVYAQVCQAGCICQEGHFRNGNNECVPRAYCSKCDPDTEVFGCFQRCDKNCTSSDDNCFSQNCTERCHCKAGYARDDEGLCVPYEKCTQASKCPENEEFGCHRTCPPKRCIALYAKFKCIPFSPINCSVRCDCKEGLLRNAQGICIDPKQCRKADSGF